MRRLALSMVVFAAVTGTNLMLAEWAGPRWIGKQAPVWIFALIVGGQIAASAWLAVEEIRVEKGNWSRWFLWTFRCVFGTRCARLVVRDEIDGVPAGAVLRMEYVCGSCGTRYESSVLVGHHGTYTQTPRKRVTDSRGTSEEARTR